MEAFIALLNPMLMLFICMAIGYTLTKCGVMPNGGATVLSKAVTWIFAPSLSFITMARSFTVEALGTGSTVFIMGLIAGTISTCISIPIGIMLAGKKELRGVFMYGLALGNMGYLGDPIVLSLFGDGVLVFYKLFTLPMTVIIYTWGIAMLVPGGTGKSVFRRLLNMPLIATVLGLFVGITGLGKFLPEFLTVTFDSLKVCLGPVAMIVAGMTIAGYSIRELIKYKRVYITTGLKMLVYPFLMCGICFLFRLLFETVFKVQIGNGIFYLVYFAYACPLGLNTVVFPKSYGGDAHPGASMAIISNTLAVISMPLLYTLLVAIVGELVL